MKTKSFNGFVEAVPNGQNVTLKGEFTVDISALPNCPSQALVALLSVNEALRNAVAQGRPMEELFQLLNSICVYGVAANLIWLEAYNQEISNTSN